MQPCLQRMILAAVCLLHSEVTFAQTAAQSPVTDSADEGVVELSPFEVTASKRDSRYYAENTLAGSRLNSNLGDLGASITVVTKQQLTDTGARDLNDVFLYEANTEGTGNYTAFRFDARGGVSDLVSGNQTGGGGIAQTPATANRVRGLAPADTSRDYYPSLARLPFDTYNTERVEISRGPNAILFGLGSAGGIVNQSTARASVYHTNAEIGLRADTEGGWRASLAVNQPIKSEQLAIYYAALHDERGFSRKPSYDVTRRHFSALTFRPLPHTTIRASLELYDNRHQRPNALTPRDLVTPWIQAGRPAWDPLNRMLTINGVIRGPLNTPSSLLEATPAVKDDQNVRPTFLTDRGEEIVWILRQIDLPGGPPNEARFTRSSGAFDQNPRAPLYVQPGISDRALYDWRRINLVSGNFGFGTAKTYNLEIEQQLRPNLHLQLGWFTEDLEGTNHYYLSQQAGATVFVDTNTRWLDGTSNPYFGAPYVEYFQPDVFEQPARNENWRATLSWELDFRRKPGWLAKLGRHRLMGLATRREIRGESRRFREVVVSTETFTATNGADAWQPNSLQNEIHRRFYVGDPGGMVTRDPGKFPNGPLETSLRTYNSATGQWFDEPVSLDNRLHYVSTELHQRTDSGALALQSHLWNDRVIVTAGWRHDRDETVNSGLWPVDRATGFTDTTGPFLNHSVQQTAGDSTTAGIVFKPLSWLSLHWNRSENFTPAPLAHDLLARLLPVPTGQGTDAGVRVSLLENRLVAGVSFFDASASDLRGGTTPVGRTVGMDSITFKSWAEGLVRSRLGGNTPAAVVETEVATIMQLPEGWLAAKNSFNTIPTSTVEAKGLEFQLMFNPAENWTLKITGAQQKAIISSVVPDWDEWVALRLPVWQAAVDDRGFPFWTGATGQIGANGGPGVSGLFVASNTPAAHWAVNVDALVRLARAGQGKVSAAEREWRWNLLTNYQFKYEHLKGLSLGGAVRWEDKAAIGYYAAPADPDGVVRNLDADRPIYDDAVAHLDLWISYATRAPRWLGDETRIKVQLNIRDAGERQKLRAVSANPDGTPNVFRIVDGQIAMLTTTVEF